MEFLAAKCPNCGGDLRLPDDKKQVKCMYCGFDIIVREAVAAAGANVENWLRLASTAEETGNHAEAYKYYTQVLEFEPDNYVALLGKGITAGYLSTPDKFRAEELIKGVKAAVENSPDNEKQEIKLKAAEKIQSVCSSFRPNDESDNSKLQRYNVANCLELAHDYAPENEQIITSLYFQYRFIAINNEGSSSISKLLTKSTEPNFFDQQAAEYNQKTEDCLLKLQTINPEQATSFRESIKKSKEDVRNLQAATSSGGGCLLTIMSLILVSLFFLVIFA